MEEDRIHAFFQELYDTQDGEKLFPLLEHARSVFDKEIKGQLIEELVLLLEGKMYFYTQLEMRTHFIPILLKAVEVGNY